MSIARFDISYKTPGIYLTHSFNSNNVPTTISSIAPDRVCHNGAANRRVRGLFFIMNGQGQGRAALANSMHRLPWALGYSLTSTWATVLLFSAAFSSAPSPALVTISMLSGVVACLSTLFLHSKGSLFNGRSGTSSLYATGMAVGTLMCTLPELAGIGPVHDVGLALSGFFAILLLLTWFEAFSRLGSRTIIMLGGCSFLLSAIGVFVILSLPVEAASIAISALPLVSFTLLPRPTEASNATPNSKATLSAILSQAVSWKTLLGIALSFFVIGAMGTLAPGLGVTVELSPVYLGIPAFLMLVFIFIAWACPRRLDASTLFKLLLIAVASIAFLLVYAGTTNLSLVFFLYITADVLLWSVLALAAKKTPVAPHAVFACGWLAECAGNVLGHNVAYVVGDTSFLFALVMLLVLVAVGFAFGDGLFVIDLDEDGEEDIAGAQGASACVSIQEGMRLGAENNADPQETSRKGRSGSLFAGHQADARMNGAAGSAAPRSNSVFAGQMNPPVSGQQTLNLNGSPEPESSGSTSTRDAIATFASHYGLSERETDVFALWVTGHGLKHIQNTLFISESTVKTHLRNIYRKCDTHNRAEIIALFEGQR